MSYVVFVKTGSAICLCSLVLVLYVMFVKPGSATSAVCCVHESGSAVCFFVKSNSNSANLYVMLVKSAGDKSCGCEACF